MLLVLSYCRRVAENDLVVVGAEMLLLTSSWVRENRYVCVAVCVELLLSWR